MRAARARFTTAGSLLVSPLLLLEIAHTPEEQAHGLMGRVFLPMDRGMLFTFAEPHRRSFWMKDTLIALDIAWLSDAGIVQETARLLPHDETLRSPKKTSRYVIEMAAGAFDLYNVRIGDQLKLLPGVTT